MLPELPPFFANVLIGLVALLMAVFFWRSTRGAKTIDTIVMRTALLFLLAPFVFAAIYGSIFSPDGSERSEQAQRPAAGSAPAPVSVGSPVPRSVQTTPAPTLPPQSVPPPVREAAVPPPSAPPPLARETAAAPPPPRPVAPPPAPITRAPESPPVAAAPSPPEPAPASSPPPVATQPPAATATPPMTRQTPGDGSRAAPVPSNEPWDVVPVYYGTDRMGETTGGRLTYGADRARRLELGRALVTVPKSHEVPNVERPWAYRLPFTRIVLFEEKEDPAKHFTLKEIKALSREELAQIVRDRLGASSEFKDQALVFLHGFNNAFENALFRTAQIAYDLKFDGAPFLYSWPSKGQLGLQDYSYDRESSGQSEPYLRQFLDFVTKETGAKTVNIIAHSMGNQVLLNVLRDLKRTAPAGVEIGQIILAAPDVDRDTFEFLAKEIAGFGKGITVLAASNDRALEASKRFWGGVPRAGDVPGGTPVVVAGIDTIDISALSTEMLSLNHSGYAQKHQLLEDMRLLLKDGTRPTVSRQPPLERVTTEKGAFWRYPMPR